MDCTGLFTLAQTIWDGTLILLALGAIGLISYACIMARKWTDFSILSLVFLAFVVLFSSLNILSAWNNILSAWTDYTIPSFVLLGAKGPLAGLLFIVAVVSLVVLPKTRPVILLKRRQEHVRQGVQYYQRRQDELRRIVTKIDRLKEQMKTRTNCLLRSLSIYLKIVPKSDVSYDRITWMMYNFRRSQDLCARNNWNGCSLQDIIKANLKMFGIEQDAVMSGPPILLDPRQTQAFYMALFELCLNSVQKTQKTQQGSRYTIQWNKYVSDNKLLLSFYWHEATTVLNSDIKPGVGYVVLEKIVPSAFDGEGKMTINPNSLDWTMTGVLGGHDEHFS